MAIEVGVFDSDMEVEVVLSVSVGLMSYIQVILKDSLEILLALYFRHLQNLPQHDLAWFFDLVWRKWRHWIIQVELYELLFRIRKHSLVQFFRDYLTQVLMDCQQVDSQVIGRKYFLEELNVVV